MLVITNWRTMGSLYQSNTFWTRLLGASWASSLSKEFLKSIELETMMEDLDDLYRTSPAPVYPKKYDIFKAFRLCPLSELKVIFLGPECYSNKNATGLSFANPKDTLDKNISPALSVLQDAVERQYPGEGINLDLTLESWAKQGVLLLNSSLTNSKGATSHTLLWNRFLREILDVATYSGGISVVLFGNIAESYRLSIHPHNEVSTLPDPIDAYIYKFPLEIDFIKINKYLHSFYGNGITWVNLIQQD